MRWAEVSMPRRADRGPAGGSFSTGTIRFLRKASLAAATCLVLAGGMDQAFASEVVAFESPGYSRGTILVKTSERKLYFLLGNGRAIRYPVGVGKSGKTWSGATYIRSKHIQPAWSPPAEIKRDNPRLPAVIPGGSPSNPMGAAALTLSRGQYAIHGTNRPNSIGGYVSYGCIRMYNDDILDLYDRVGVGTPVVVKR